MDGDTQGEAANDSSTIKPDRRPEILQPAVALTSALKAIGRLNRSTTWVATGLLGSVVFAAVMVAVRDPHPKTADVTDVSQQFKSDFSPTTNPAADFSVAGSTEERAGEANSGQATSVDFGFTPEPKHAPPAVAANETSSSPTLRPHHVRNARLKTPNLRHRSSMRCGIVTFRLRLIALWCRSLLRNESSRRRIPSSDRNKVNYVKRTADTLKRQ
jgi:hypothetical protein